MYFYLRKRYYLLITLALYINDIVLTYLNLSIRSLRVASDGRIFYLLLRPSIVNTVL